MSKVELIKDHSCIYDVLLEKGLFTTVGQPASDGVFLPFRPDEVITPKDDPIVQEISDVLREWSFVWKRLYAVSLINVLPY